MSNVNELYINVLIVQYPCHNVLNLLKLSFGSDVILYFGEGRKRGNLSIRVESKDDSVNWNYECSFD